MHNLFVEDASFPNFAISPDEIISMKGNSTFHANDIQQNEKVSSSCSDSVQDTIHECYGVISLYRGMGDRNLFTQEYSAENDSHSLNSGGQEAKDVTVEMPLPSVFALRRIHAKSEHPSSGRKYNDIDRSNNSECSSNNNITSRSRGGMADQDKKEWEVSKLSSVWDRRHDPDVFIVIADTSASYSALGWGVRNVLALIGAHTGSYTVPVPVRDDTDNGIEDDSVRTALQSCDSKVDVSCSPSGDSTMKSGVHLMTNIIALRGLIAKRIYACASDEKVVEFLSGLTNDEIGESVSISYYDCVLHLVFRFVLIKSKKAMATSFSLPLFCLSLSRFLCEVLCSSAHVFYNFNCLSLITFIHRPLLHSILSQFPS